MKLFAAAFFALCAVTLVNADRYHDHAVEEERHGNIRSSEYEAPYHQAREGDGHFMQECELVAGNKELCEMLNEIANSPEPEVQEGRGAALDSGHRCYSKYQTLREECKWIPTCKPCIDKALGLTGGLKRSVAVAACGSAIVCGDTGNWHPFPKCKDAANALAPCTFLFGGA